MTLADFTNAGLIIPRLRGADVAGVIQELSQAMQRAGRIPDLLPFYHAALNREFLVSTDVEAGMAFPHARQPGIKELVFALGRSEAPLHWGPPNGRMVSLVFLIGVPATDATQHLLLVSGLVRLGREARLVAALHDAQSAQEMLSVLQQVQLRNNPSQESLHPAAQSR